MDYCEVCHQRLAVMWDGIVGYHLCDDSGCLDIAWDRGFNGSKANETGWRE